jgi:hypothetical protein
MSQENQQNNPIPEQLERELQDPKIPVEPDDALDRINEAFNQTPEPSNADNTAIDPMGNIHSGSALPDPIGDQLQGETDAESREYYQEDILDEDPVLGSPRGVGNVSAGTDLINEVADEDENVIDRLEQIALEERERLK